MADIALLSALAVAAAAFRTFVRVPLRLPSHSVLQWLPVVILGQLWVRRSWAGLYQGSLIGAICCFHPGRIMLTFSALAPLTEYVLAGGVVSWLLHRSLSAKPLRWRVWLLFLLVGLLANLARVGYRMAYFLPRPEQVLRFYGPVQFIVFYVLFGLAAGLLAAIMYTLFSRAGEGNRDPVDN